LLDALSQRLYELQQRPIIDGRQRHGLPSPRAALVCAIALFLDGLSILGLRKTFEVSVIPK
jgi:hypothetical protein